MIRSLLAGASVAALSTSALAADIYVPEAEAAYVQEAAISSWVGYVEAYLGYIDQDFDYAQSDEEDFLVGGAARAAWLVSPGFSTQFDLWSEFEDDDNLTGAAIHLTGRGQMAYFGALASLGYSSDGESTLASVGVEGGVAFGNFDLYGQIGYTTGIDGDYVDQYPPDFLYAHARATYFFNPNLLLAGDLGYYDFEEDDGAYSGDGLRWGATVETKMDLSPFSWFLAYQGGTQDWDDDGPELVEHIAKIGLRWNFGTGTLRDREGAVGLVDYNPIYGANAARHYFDYD